MGFGIFLVYYLLDKIDIADIKDAFINIYKPALVAGLLVMLSSNYFRAYRKNILVGSDRIGMGDMFLVSMIRNAFNMGLPIFEASGVSEGIDGGDQVSVNENTGEIVDLTNGRTFLAKPIPPFMQELIEAGGLMAYVLKKREQ